MVEQLMQALQIASMAKNLVANQQQPQQQVQLLSNADQRKQLLGRIAQNLNQRI
jgi:hypothetical protein